MSDKFENKKDTPKQAPVDNWLEKLNNPKAALVIKGTILKDIFSVARHYKLDAVISSDFSGSKSKDTIENLKHTFASYGMILERMELAYPEDKDLIIIKKLVHDIEADIYASNEGQNLNLDQSIADILVHEEGKSFKKIDINNKEEVPLEYSKLLENIIRLKNMGIEPDYAVLSSNPDAPTHVVFLEEHSQFNNEVSRKSRTYIEKSFDQAITNNFVLDIYMEGSEADRLYHFKNPKSIIELGDRASAISRIGFKFSNRINIFGTEFMDLTDGNITDTLEELRAEAIKAGAKNNDEVNDYLVKNHNLTLENIYFKRMTFENIFIAMNMRDKINERKSTISFGIIGYLHEKGMKSKRTSKLEKHPLPLSDLLANNGINVIVVDATSK